MTCGDATGVSEDAGVSDAVGVSDTDADAAGRARQTLAERLAGGVGADASDADANGRALPTLAERLAGAVGAARLFGTFAVDLDGAAGRYGCPRGEVRAALADLAALGIVTMRPDGRWCVPLATALQICGEFAARRRREPAVLADAIRVPAARAAALADRAAMPPDAVEAALLIADPDGAPLRAAIDGTRRALHGCGLPADAAADARLAAILHHLARNEHAPAARLHADHLDAAAEALIAQCKLAPILAPPAAAAFLRPLP